MLDEQVAEIDNSNLLLVIENINEDGSANLEENGEVTLYSRDILISVNHIDGTPLEESFDYTTLLENLDGAKVITDAQLAEHLIKMSDSEMGKYFAHNPEKVAEHYELESIEDADFQTHDDSVNSHVQLVNEIAIESESREALALLRAAGMGEYADKLSNLICHSLAHEVIQQQTN
ncbi:hypothetical protein [Vibrio harveyi]|uniref:hypothetical protein n=1 Tax=Vibrio harveyi TaxID=669 RepID=UPI003CE7248F